MGKVCQHDNSTTWLYIDSLSLIVKKETHQGRKRVNVDKNSLICVLVPNNRFEPLSIIQIQKYLQNQSIVTFHGLEWVVNKLYFISGVRHEWVIVAKWCLVSDVWYLGDYKNETFLWCTWIYTFNCWVPTKRDEQDIFSGFIVNRKVMFWLSLIFFWSLIFRYVIIVIFIRLKRSLRGLLMKREMKTASQKW